MTGFMPNMPMGTPDLQYAYQDPNLLQQQYMQQHPQTTQTAQTPSDQAPGPSEPTAPPEPPAPPVMPPTLDPTAPTAAPTTPAATPTGIAGTFASPQLQSSLAPFRTANMFQDRQLFGANTAGVPFAGSGLGMSPDSGNSGDHQNPEDEMRRQAAKEALMTQFFAQ